MRCKNIHNSHVKLKEHNKILCRHNIHYRENINTHQNIIILNLCLYGINYATAHEMHVASCDVSHELPWAAHRCITLINLIPTPASMGCAQVHNAHKSDPNAGFHGLRTGA